MKKPSVQDSSVTVERTVTAGLWASVKKERKRKRNLNSKFGPASYTL